MKKIKRVFCLNLIQALLLSLLSLILLAFVFMMHLEESAFAFAVYPLSAYALVVLIVSIVHQAMPAYEKIMQIQFVRQYVDDMNFRMKCILYSSLLFHSLYACMKLIAGLMLDSLWNIQIGLYYLLLVLCRFTFLYHVNYNELGNDLLLEYKKYKRCGYFLVGINAVWMITAVYIVLYNNAYSYPGTLIYVAALYAFYSIIAAIIKVIRWRKRKSPLMHAINHLHLVTAMISIFSLQTAMLSQFGSQDLAMKQLANSVTGGISCVLVMIIGIYMILYARKEIKMIRK